MPTEDELRIASEIMRTVRRLQLPLKLDEITEGRGNCFPLAILAQGKRNEILRELRSMAQSLMLQNDTTLFRREVYKVITNSRHKTIQNYKRAYEDILASIDGKNWEEYWRVMLRNYEWVDYIFIQSAAWYLHHDIIIVTTTSTEKNPYITISGNLLNENIPCQGISLTIGSKSNVHYQSLLPLEIRVTRSQLKPSLPENTINLEVETLSRRKENPGLNMDSREEFPDLIPSRSRSQANSEDKSATEMKTSTRQVNQTNPK